MAMAVNYGFPPELRRAVVRFANQEFAQEEGLLLQALGVSLHHRVVAEQVGHLVAEDGDAAGLQADQWNSGGDLWTQRFQNLLQPGPGLVQHAEVVQRTPAT